MLLSSSQRSSQTSLSNLNSTLITFSNSTCTINAKIANNSNTRANGLMYLQSMPQNEGMLFVYEKSDKQYFWMANTYMFLDILFLDENKSIIDIQKMQPCNQPLTKNCKRYISSKPSLYAIELNQNVSDICNIRVGSVASWSGVE